MKHREKPDTSTASLQRLLALDKTFDTFEQRIHEAARILQIPLDQPPLEADLLHEPPTPIQNASRHDFVLRWLLDKLRTSPEAYTCPTAWTFLRYLVQTVPPANLVKALSGLPFVSTIVTAVERIFPSETLPPSLAASLSHSRSSDAEPDSLPTSRKRKRGTTTRHHVPAQPGSRADHKSTLFIFLDITAIFDTLVMLKEDDSTTPPLLRNQIQSLISMTLPDLIKLIKHWLAALLHCATASISQGSCEWTNLVTGSLTVLLQVWMLQPASQTLYKDALSEAFCRECLWPVTLLLASFPSAVDCRSPGELKAADAVRLLERIIAQQVFIPARSAYMANTGDANTSVPKSAHTGTLGLEERIQPCHSKMMALNSSVDQGLLVLSQKAIPAMFDIAIRCTPISTPKRKIAESPWINHLFVALSSFMNEAQVLTDETSVRSCNATLVDMLTILQHRGLSLSKETLVDVVQEHCRLLDRAEQGRKLGEYSRTTPDFKLVAVILSMDASIFTDMESAYTEALFDALTLNGGDSLSIIHQSQHSSSVEPGIERTLTSSIVVPLMKAFARIRNLQGFLGEWFTRLEGVSMRGNHEGHIWLDVALQDAVSDVLEASMTAAQICDLLELRRRPIAELALKHRGPSSKGTLDVAPSSKTLRETFASSVLLSTIVLALRSDETAEAASMALQPLVVDIEQIFDQTSLDSGRTLDHLLPLLSRLYGLWYPLRSISQTKSEVQTGAMVTLGSKVVQHALQAVNPDDNSTTTLLAADAAFVLISTICDLSRRIDPTCREKIIIVMRQAVLGSAGIAGGSGKSYLAWRPLQFAAAMATFPSLIEFVCEKESERGLISELLSTKSSLPRSSQTVLQGFVNSVASSGFEEVRTDLFDEILERLSTDLQDSEPAVDLLLSCPVRSMSRHQRESALNVIVDVIAQSESSSPDVLQKCLSFAVSLMGVPNATARISTDASIIKGMADALSTKRNISSSAFCLFDDLCASLLRHILDTKDQDRSKAFLEGLSHLAVKVMTEKKEERIWLSAGPIRLLTVFLKSTEARITADVLASFPHRSPAAVDSFIRRLYTQLSIFADSPVPSAHDENSVDGAIAATDAFVSLPASLVACGSSSATKYSQKLVKLLSKLLSSTETPEGVLADKQNSVPLKLLVRCYARASRELVGESALQLCTVTELLLARGPDAKDYYAIMQAFTIAVRNKSDTDKLHLIGSLLYTSESTELSAERVALVQCTISSINQSGSKSLEDSTASSPLIRMLEILAEEVEYDVFLQLIKCINTVLREKPSLVSQYSLEMIVETMIKLASPRSPLRDTRNSSTIYEAVCSTTQSLLQFHRASLGGRLHLFVPLLQRLLACLFVPAGRDAATKSRFKHPPWLSTQNHLLTVKHSQRFGRLLTLLCNPPQSNSAGHRRKQDTAPELVDETRKLRIQVGQHVHQILHYFCVLVLNGKLGEGMRDSLTPGLWAVIEVTEMDADNSKGVKALSASMGNAERAVLRGIWEEYRRFGGAWKG